MPLRTPGLCSFALVIFAVSCLMSLALDFGPVMDSPDFVGGLVGSAFPGVLVALLVAAVSFWDPKGRRGLLWRAGPPAVVFGLLRALQFVASLSPVTDDGKPPVDLSLAGGTGVFLVGAGLTVLAMLAVRRLLAAMEARKAQAGAAATPGAGADYVGSFGLFAGVMTVMALLLTELLVGPALPPPHLLTLAQTAALPLGFCLLAGVFGFRAARPDRPLGRRMTPGLLAYCLVWTASGMLTIVKLGGGAGEMLLGLFPGLATSFLIAMLSAFALYAAQALVRQWHRRRPVS